MQMNGPDHIKTGPSTATERPLVTAGSESTLRHMQKHTECRHCSCGKVKKSGWKGKEGELGLEGTKEGTFQG